MTLYVLLESWLQALRDRADGDRGDVPGWVMVTVMSAILVVAIIGVFEPEIKDALGGVFDSISDSSN